MVRIDAGEPRRVALQQKLSLVLRDIEAGARKIAKQREIIAKLDARGYDTTEAIRKLANFEREHALTVASHRQIMRELMALGRSPASTASAGSARGRDNTTRRTEAVVRKK